MLRFKYFNIPKLKILLYNLLSMGSFSSLLIYELYTRHRPENFHLFISTTYQYD